MKEVNVARVLVVDDDPAARDALAKLLTAEGLQVELAEDGRDALQKTEERAPDLVVTDISMPNMDGLELLGILRRTHKDLPVIVVTSAEDVGVAVKAMRAGAADFITKPIDMDALVVSIERALEHRDVKLEAETLRRQLDAKSTEGLEGLLGTSAPMRRIYGIAKRVAPSRATVLITGESGTGKGELARAIHALSPRAQKPFISVHCASLAESLLESELFGHEKGSFTGADKKREGRFEQAHEGTLFLDEVGEIPPQTQVKLLNVLQERTFERVGGNELVHTDVRVIAATNRDIVEEVHAGRFREDLYYRLNVVHLEMPPLRLRGSDVLILADHFLRRFSLENHKRIDGLTEKAKTKLIGHRWPGNVRALENAMERAVVLTEGTSIDEDDLPFEAAPDVTGLRIPGSTMGEIEKHAILKTLEAVSGSTSRAAEILDISVRTIQYRLHEYGLAKDRAKGG